MTDHNPPVTGYPAPPPPNGYAHPYPAPNGHPHPYPPNHYFNVAGPPPYPNRQRTTFLRRIFTVFIGTIIIIGTIFFIIWLVLRPQLPQFRVQTLTLTNFTVTSNSMISGTWTAGLTVRNPNTKITLHYFDIQAAVFYKSSSIAVTNVPPFVQGKKNETSVRATLVAVSDYFDGWKGIDRERGRGMVEFNLRMVGRVGFKASGWWTRRRVLRVYCPGLGVRVEGNGTGGLLSGGGKACGVGV
ncbi:putative Late embryogenesis abundant protein [Helianthus annuus]|nr:putative Late embryogenesis abundant protein [Helianthus annuus]